MLVYTYIHVHIHIESLEKEKVLSFLSLAAVGGATAVNFWSFSFQNSEVEKFKSKFWIFRFFDFLAVGAYSPLCYHFRIRSSLEIGEKSFKKFWELLARLFLTFSSEKKERENQLEGEISWRWTGCIHLSGSPWPTYLKKKKKKEVDSSCCRVRSKWRPEHFLFNLRPSARVLDDGGKTEPLSFSLRLRRIIKHFPSPVYFWFVSKIPVHDIYIHDHRK